ncbi:MAG: 16S rRNA (cytosine(1402)-N(4))-methyltransferase RsmH [Candidatus Doudnabacteria bacterium]|nr:16S rRNA (cytosine(1402)-N(4))-methyltransferase RsmH [Candidatus Doudnabacteria bacterium]
MHVPVLLQEVLSYLDPKPGEKYIDATIGGGGHAKELINHDGIVLGIDADSLAVNQLNSEFRIQKSKIKIVQGNFANLEEIAKTHGFTEVAGILFDLGLSSNQLDDPQRGFAFQKEGPLDMRYDTSGEFKNQKSKIKNAADIVNYYSEKELVEIFYKYGEEKRFGKKIARAIAEARQTRPLKTTTELFELIKKALPGKFRHKAGDVARRIFQSLRIAVNGELISLEKALPQALRLLKSAGRLVVISFHSLEDRIVKQFFVRMAKNCICPPDFPICTCGANAQLRILTKKPVTASQEEIKINPRAHSAKLRAAEKIWEDISL